MRGGDTSTLICTPIKVGRSPRARGRRHEELLRRTSPRSIPACAGETTAGRRGTLQTQVDPRVRGGDARRHVRRYRAGGRSPRARGRPLHSMRRHLTDGSIPACAGETAGQGCTLHRKRVDPRVRGGDTTSPAAIDLTGGRSPRARGRRTSTASPPATGRSIPACAGETVCCNVLTLMQWVDPRVRGGDASSRICLSRVTGRSPRARGRR